MSITSGNFDGSMTVKIDPKYLPEDIMELSPKVTIFDLTNPRSLINIVWKDLAETMHAIQAERPDLLAYTERGLEKKISPDPTDCRLRLRFWDEYSRAQDRGKRILSEEVCRGVCAKDYWDRNISKNFEKIAWIILPPANYVTTMEELLYRGLDRVREVLDMPLKDAKGNANTRLISEVVKIVQMLDQRVKGAIIQKVAIQQRIDQRTQHSFQQGMVDPLSLQSSNDLEAIESQLSHLNQKLERWQKAGPEVLEIEARVGGCDERSGWQRGTDGIANNAEGGFEVSRSEVEAAEASDS